MNGDRERFQHPLKKIVWFKVLRCLRRWHDGRVERHDVEGVLACSMVSRREVQLMLVHVGTHLVRWG